MVGSSRQMLIFEKIFSDGLACRLPIFLTKEEPFQNQDSNAGLRERQIETSVVVNTHANSNCLIQSSRFFFFTIECKTKINTNSVIVQIYNDD